MCAVCTNEIVEVHLDLGHSVARPRWRSFSWRPALKPGFIGAKVSAGQLVVEEELDVGRALKLVEERIIQCASVYGVDGLDWGLPVSFPSW